MKINFTINSNIKLDKTLHDLKVNYGVVYHIDKTHDSITSKDSFSIKLIGKIESVIRIFKKIDKTQQNSINAIAQVVHYSNEYMAPEMINGLKVHINTKTKTNELYDNALIGITKHILDFGTRKASYLHNKKMILLGTSSLENTFLSTKEKFSTKDISQFIFFHEFSHGLEKFYRYDMNKDKQDISLSIDYDIFMTKIFLASVDKYTLNLNEQVNKYNASTNDCSTFTTINQSYLKKMETLASENYADVSAILHLRNYQIRNNTYNHENFVDFINCIANDRASDQKKLYTLEQDESNHPLTSFILSMGHFTTNALLDLKTQIKSLNNDVLTNNDIHHLTNRTTEKAMLKTIYMLTKTDNNMEKMFSTCCSAGMEDKKLILGSSYYSYNRFQHFLENKLDIVWLSDFNHSLFMLKKEIKDPEKLMEAYSNILCYPDKYQEQLAKNVQEFTTENLTTNTVKEKIHHLKTSKLEDNNVLINKI